MNKPVQSLAYFSLDAVSIGVNGAALLSDIQLQLAQGDIGCLLGPSGCGKSTLLRIIAGFEEASGGQIALGGHILSQPGQSVAAEKRSIGMVFQDYSLFPHLNAIKNVMFGLHSMSKDEAESVARRWLAQIGLAGREQAMPHELSGGEQQRVALARALAPEPELILLDEPFSSLDLELREKLGREVRSIFKASNTTALMVTHDQHEAFAIADSIGILHNGCLEQWGSVYDVYHRPASRFVADFVGQGVLLAGEIVSGEVRTAIGTFKLNNGALAGRQFDDGDAVDVLLRPDDVIHDDASDMTLRVVAKYFRGAEFLYTLALENGEQLLALVPSHHDHGIGENIGVRLEVDHVVVYPRPQAQHRR